MGSEYSFDQDEVWRQAAEAAEREVSKAKRQVAARCRELGIPDRFAPSLELNWRHRGWTMQSKNGARNCSTWRKPKLRQTNSGRSFKSKYPASTPKRS
jgi:hypothetical protein